MPKKIPLIQKREWLEAYEQGNSEVAIAKKTRYDVRTVKKGVGQARSERDAQLARSELLKEALKKHQNELMGVVVIIGAALQMPSKDLELPWTLSMEPVTLSTGVAHLLATYESLGQPLVEVSIDVEKTTLWELLQEHLRRDKLWTELSQWKKKLKAYFEACIALNYRTAALLEEKTGLPVGEEPSEGTFLYADALYYVSAIAVNKAMVASSHMDLENDIFIERDGAIVHRGGVRLALAPGKEEQCRQGILSAVTELLKSAEFEEVRRTFKDVEAQIAKTRRVMEEITLLGLVPGTCRVCRRLGV